MSGGSLDVRWASWKPRARTRGGGAGKRSPPSCKRYARERRSPKAPLVMMVDHQRTAIMENAHLVLFRGKLRRKRWWSSTTKAARFFPGL